MLAIMADHDIEGQMQVLLRVLRSREWNALWTELGIPVESFAGLGLSPSTSDAVLWHFCQTRQIILLTGNRNHESPESLEATLQVATTPKSLPVLTISEPRRVINSAEYASRVVAKLIEYLFDIEDLRGTRRLYLP
jgi:hypothetical protein